MSDIILYSKVSNLKNRLELGVEYSARQIDEAIKMIDAVNKLLDRRKRAV